MNVSGSHSKVSPSTDEGLSELASRGVEDEYHVVSDPIIASIHYEAFSKHLTSYVEKGWGFAIFIHSIYSYSRVFFRGRGHDSTSWTTTEAREAYSTAVPGTLYGRLR